MPRLSRAESQARTRELLVSTAREMFLRDGYHATSLEKVADAAGFSKGAVYSNFRNKDELCLAVLDAINADVLDAALAEAGRAETLAEGIAGFERWTQRMLGDEDWTTLHVEFALHARRDPVLRGEVVRRERARRDTIARILNSRADELPARPSMSIEDVASALSALGVGLAVQRVVDPETPLGVLMSTLRELIGQRDAPRRDGPEPVTPSARPSSN